MAAQKFQSQAKNQVIQGSQLFGNLKPLKNADAQINVKAVEKRDIFKEIPQKPIRKKEATELLAEYEKRRIEFEKLQQNKMHDGGDPIYFADLSRAIKRMSYDYQMIEEKQKKKHNLTKQVQANIQKYKLEQINDQIDSASSKKVPDFSDNVSKLNRDRSQSPDDKDGASIKKEGEQVMYSLNYFEPRDFQSDIAKFNLLKTLNNYANVSNPEIFIEHSYFLVDPHK